MWSSGSRWARILSVWSPRLWRAARSCIRLVGQHVQPGPSCGARAGCGAGSAGCAAVGWSRSSHCASTVRSWSRSRASASSSTLSAARPGPGRWPRSAGWRTRCRAACPSGGCAGGRPGPRRPGSGRHGERPGAGRVCRPRARASRAGRSLSVRAEQVGQPPRAHPGCALAEIHRVWAAAGRSCFGGSLGTPWGWRSCWLLFDHPGESRWDPGQFVDAWPTAACVRWHPRSSVSSGDLMSGLAVNQAARREGRLRFPPRPHCVAPRPLRPCAPYRSRVSRGGGRRAAG